MRLLLERGDVDVDTKRGNGLFSAVSKGHEAIVWLVWFCAATA